MTTYEHRFDTAATGAGTFARRTGRWLGGRMATGLRRIQYGQMVSVLNQLPDIYLQEAGIRRCDIPEHARRAVYGKK